MKTILITGSTGWIGSALATHFEANPHYSVIHCSRNAKTSSPWRQLPDCSEINTPLEHLFDQVDTVVHTAARAHHPSDSNGHSTSQLYDSINSKATVKLASAAERSGVKDFIFLSSIKAIGELTDAAPIDENSPPNPSDAYGKSKLQAEKGLLQLSKRSTMRIHILRLPLVVSSKAKGNLERLENLLRKGLPLPLASIKNRRSLLSLQNLIDGIIALADTPPPNSDLYCLCDDHPLSTPELVSILGSSINCPATLWHFPTPILALAFRILGKKSEWEKLAGSLTMNNEKFKKTINWTPTLSSMNAFQKV